MMLFTYSRRIAIYAASCSLILLTLLAACATDQALEPTTSNSTTPYAVGSTTRFIHDISRPLDADAGITTGVRTLITELWYPAAHDNINSSLAPATYGDYVFGNRDVHRLMMTQTTNFHLTAKTVRAGVTQAQIDSAISELFDRHRGSYTNAQPAESDPWPVVVVSHGDAGSRYNMQTVSEHLAAHGYFVIAPEHTGNSPFSMIGADPALSAGGGDAQFKTLMASVLELLDDNGVYGSDGAYGQSYSPLADGGSTPAPLDVVALDNSLLERVRDLRATLDELETMNRQGGFAGKLDLSRVALIGRSFGGATTLAALALEERFTAGVAVVPPSVPDLRAAVPAAALVKSPQESVLLGDSEKTAFGQLHKPTLLVMGGEDQLILQLAADMAKATGGTAPTPDNAYPVLHEAFDSSAVPAVFAILQNTNHASLSTAGPYWWPSLKPNSFPKFFKPHEEYQLTNAATAHRIQLEMILAFLNAMLRGDETGKAVLRNNPWAEHNTQIELRQF